MDIQIADAMTGGAEASILISEFLGRDSIVKIRSPKAYRHRDLDEHIRSSRMRNEVRLIREARSALVRTPVIYDVDTAECSITMEHVHGMKAKDALDAAPEKADWICSMIGSTLARLHNAGICHGDLTTSNMIITESNELCLIDFSMGTTSAEIEDMGVDIRLLERAFSSAHPGLQEAYGKLLESYSAEMGRSGEVFRKLEEIKSRGRYT